MGDIVLLKYLGHFKDDYCMAKVTEIHPGDDGLVRVATVRYRKKDGRESPAVYKTKPLMSDRVGIQRVHKLHLVDHDLQSTLSPTYS